MKTIPTPTHNPTLLDCFAMAALTGMLAGEAYSGTEGENWYTPQRAATRAYDIAEEMLAEKRRREAR